MNPASKYRTGFRFGILTGIIYVVLLFIRYTFFSSDPSSLFSFALFSYFFVIIGMYLFTGITRKKELGGYAEFKEIFQSIFIAILITELFYIAFNFIYFKFINPDFMDHFRTSSLLYFQKLGLDRGQINMKMAGVDDLMTQLKPKGLVKGYAASVILGSIFGFIFAAIVQRKKPVPIEKSPEPKS
jgi:hypothetical protein